MSVEQPSQNSQSVATSRSSFDHGAVDHEKRGLWLSIFGAVFMAGLGIGFAILASSDAVLLDGLFSTYFAHNSKKVLNKQLDILYQNKPLMIQASIAFVVIFLHFLNDAKYYIHGISVEGIQPK